MRQVKGFKAFQQTICKEIMKQSKNIKIIKWNEKKLKHAF